jgi:hypothetical protein
MTGAELRNVPEACASLERPDPSRLCDLDGLDSHASDGKVLIWGRDSVRHCDGLRSSGLRVIGCWCLRKSGAVKLL